MDNVLISNQDIDWFKQYKWFLGKNGYLVRNVKLDTNRWTQRYLHREIAERMNLDIDNKFVDHINRIKIDNRRINLRSLTKAQSTYNTGKLGICWDKSRKKWYLRIYRDKRLVWSKRVLDYNLAIKERELMRKEIDRRYL